MKHAHWKTLENAMIRKKKLRSKLLQPDVINISDDLQHTYLLYVSALRLRRQICNVSLTPWNPPVYQSGQARLCCGNKYAPNLSGFAHKTDVLLTL